jgi:UDP-glucose:(heptosyl)LPS alpha-1,3-glucosyltransferase
MRIAIVSIRFDRKGGSERRTWHLARGLADAGSTVSIFAADVEAPDFEAEVNLVPVMPGPSFLKVSSFKNNLLRMLSGRSDIDLVHNQIRPFTDGVVTVGGGCHAEYLERMGKRLVFLNPLHRVILNMEKERYRPGGCKAVITNSEFSKQGLLRHYPIPPEKVFVAYNGVDLVKFNPANVKLKGHETRRKYGFKDEPVALFIGTGFRRKGLQTAIKALWYAKDMEGDVSGLKLLVAGKDDPGPFLKMAGKLGVADRLVFTGHVRDPESLYGASDIYVLPTKYDPFSNSCLEAMASGLPVITTSQNGVAEVIKDGVDGFVINDPDDAAGLAAALQYLSCEKAREETGKKAREKAENFTWEKTLHKTLEVYKKVI